ncbi:MAG: TonB-dependent receptor [Bacteroidaceae bacterium]|nr:TonB-dependent receptor [Bacteroidaceae bacterium]
MLQTNQKRRLVSLLVMLVVGLVAFAQSLTGVVKDKDGNPIIGASVMVKGTSFGAITNFDGQYSINKVPQKATIEVSYVGYLTQSVAYKNQSELNFVLEEDVASLDEVVVVGYGVQRKSDVTGALVRVDEKALTAKPVNNALEALQGKAAGVDITSGTRPGSLGSIRIRGNRSLNASNEPLYVVDGVPLNSGGIETLNTHDIESIDILKDASSTAIYGSRGANGVVLVTTKRGKAGQFHLNYNGSATWETVKDKSPAMSASDYITWRRWAYYNTPGQTKYKPGNEPDKDLDQEMFAGDNVALANINKGWASGSWDPSAVTDTDWTKFVSQTGFTHEHSLSANGGNERIQGSASFGFLNNDGTVKGQNYRRYNFSANVDVQAKPWIRLGGSVNLSYSEQKYGFSKTGQSSNSGPEDLYAAAKAILRYTLPYDEKGDLITTPGGNTTNTYTVIDEWNKSTDNRQGFRALGSFYGLIDFGNIVDVLNGLQYKIAFGPDFRFTRQGIFIDANSAVRAGSSNYVSRKETRDFAWTLDNMILYNRTFGNHTVGVTLLQSATKYNIEGSSLSEQNLPYPSMMWNNMGVIDITNSAYKASMGTSLSERALSSYMARVNYSFMDKYLVTVSGRWDGASVLAKGNKWDFFPSAAIGWRIDQENFMKNVSWIDQLKLRVGVGATGNSAVDPYGTLGVISSYWMPFSTGNSMILVTNEPYYTSGSNKMPNKNLKWERTTQWNFGVDFSFIRGRLGGSIDVYTSRTSDLLMTQTIPSLSGYPSQLANVGATKNWGIDITLNAVPVKVAGFEWNSVLNLAYQKDEITALADGATEDINNSWFVGERISVFYGYAANGLWQESDKDEMEKFNKNGHNFRAGMVRPVDQDGNYKIDAKDRVILGSSTPNWTAGWVNTFSWKGIELALELYGRFGFMVNTGGEGQLGMYQQREISYWTPQNTGADYQMPIYSTSGGDSYSSLLGFKKASFIKLRNISLGYNFDKKLCKAMRIENLKVYFQAKNLGDVYSSIDFMDLDLGRTYYNRGFTLGLNIGF